MEKLIIIRDEKGLQELSNYLYDKEYIAVDTETTGLDHDSQVVGISFSADLEMGYYIVIKQWNKTTQTLDPVMDTGGIWAFLVQLQDKKLVMHNAIFDTTMIKQNFKVDLMLSVHTDTMILSHLLDENRSHALKDLGKDFFGEDSVKEQEEVHASVKANGGALTKANFELYKADSELLGKYGAKDTILTLKLFYTLVPQLYEQGLDKFFYEDESMPLLRGPTYDMNTTGLKVDQERLQNLKNELEAECLELKTYIMREIKPHIEDKYPGTSKANTFNIGSSQQLAWLLFIKLGQPFHNLTDSGKKVCKALGQRVPYTNKAKREFIQAITDQHGGIWAPEGRSLKTGKITKAKRVQDVAKYLCTDAETLQLYANKYTWVEKLLQYNKNLKLLNTYVLGIQEQMKYGIIRPRFNQSGTTSGRYSSSQPNFQNLPRDDKRIKACIIARPGMVFVGADYSQLEPRVFASQSGDKRLIECFKNGDDFYSVVGSGTFAKEGYSLKKTEEGSFAKLFPKERQIAKEDVALASVYGTTASKMAPAIGKSIEEAQEILDNYFKAFPGVRNFMLESHEIVKRDGVVYSLYGRPRRIPEAKNIEKIYGKTKHADLPYQARTLLNLACNHRVQSTGASIVNRAAIQVKKEIEDVKEVDLERQDQWAQVRIVLQVHDSLIVECPEGLMEYMAHILQNAMEHTTLLPQVALEAEPKMGCNLSEV